MDVRRQAELTGQGIDYLAALDTEDAAVRLAALDAIIAKAQARKADIQAEVQAKIDALNQ